MKGKDVTPVFPTRHGSYDKNYDAIVITSENCDDGKKDDYSLDKEEMGMINVNK
jgi:hypothetical protein